MIHPYHQKHNLTSIRPHRIFQAVIQPRILKPIKASKHYTRYQIFNLFETLNGIDTFSAISYGNFDSKSNILSESEAR